MDIGDLSPAFIRCRDLRHRWEPYDAELLPRKAGYIQTLRCDRCGTERIRTVVKGYVVSTRHRYPDGYLFHGVGRLTQEDNAEIRLQSIMDALEGRHGS